MTDGCKVADRPTAGVDRNELYELMVGRLGAHPVARQQRPVADIPPVLTVDNRSSGRHFKKISFDIRPGRCAWLRRGRILPRLVWRRRIAQRKIQRPLYRCPTFQQLIERAYHRCNCRDATRTRGAGLALRSEASRQAAMKRRPSLSQTKSVSNQRAKPCSLVGAINRLATTSTSARSPSDTPSSRPRPPS